MKELTTTQLEKLDGAGRWGDFLTGFGCGVGLVAAGIAMASPEPFSKAALFVYGSSFGSCVSYFL